MTEKKRTLIGLLKRKPELVAFLGLVFFIGFSIFVGSKLHTRFKEEKVLPPVKKTSLKVKITGSDKEAKSGKSKQKIQSQTFFLHPSAAEILSMVKQLSVSKLPVIKKKYSDLRVLWPVYFFEVQKREGDKATVLCDGSKNGFGVTIKTVVDIGTYPQILSVKRGKKIWLAGKIAGVDGAGTGTIFLKTEAIRFESEPPEFVRRAEKKK